MTKTERRRKENEAVSEMVDFRDALPKILARVADLNDLKSWKAAFPGIKFMEVDEGLTGKQIDWEERSPIEKAAYVAYMTDTRKIEIDYEIVIEGYDISVQIRDSERAWYLWFYGCFDYFVNNKGGYVSDTAKRVLFGYAAQRAGDFEGLIQDNISLNEVCLSFFQMKTAPAV